MEDAESLSSGQTSNEVACCAAFCGDSGAAVHSPRTSFTLEALDESNQLFQALHDAWLFVGKASLVRPR